MRSLFRVLVISPILLALVACGSSSTGAAAPKTEIIVDAAASLQDAFTALDASFEKQQGNVTVTVNFAGSQDLAKQITQGAPVDVFASANNTQMQVVVKGGQIDSAAPKTFARNRLIVITPKDNPAKISALTDLDKPGLKVVLAAQAVPVGQYALDFLTKASADPTYGSGFKDAVIQNVVSYEQDVKSVFAKVQLGEADAGIVYTTDVSVNGDKVGQLAIPDALNTIAVYPIAPITASQHAALAAAYVTYVLSPAGQAILNKYGFLPPA